MHKIKKKTNNTSISKNFLLLFLRCHTSITAPSHYRSYSFSVFPSASSYRGPPASHLSAAYSPFYCPLPFQAGSLQQSRSYSRPVFATCRFSFLCCRSQTQVLLLFQPGNQQPLPVASPDY